MERMYQGRTLGGDPGEPPSLTTPELLHHHDVAGVDLAAPLRRRPAGSNEPREVGRQSLCVLEIAAVHELVVHMRKPVRVARKPHVRDGLTASHAIADLDRDGA